MLHDEPADKVAQYIQTTRHNSGSRKCKKTIYRHFHISCTCADIDEAAAAGAVGDDDVAGSDDATLFAEGCTHLSTNECNDNVVLRLCH